MKRFSLFAAVLLVAACQSEAPDLKLNDLGYFERQGVNVLVFSNPFSGGFNDEKDSGIEVVHHGVRTIQGGAVRLSPTPEQWDLVPTMTSRTVDTLAQTIEVGMRYDWYDFNSRVVVEPKGKAVEISVYLDKPVRFRRHWQAKRASTWNSCPRSTGTRPTWWMASPTASRGMR